MVEGYRLLVVDHDDTAVASTPQIHFPAYRATLRRLRPELPEPTIEGFYLANFHPGFSQHLRGELGLSEAEIRVEYEIWRAHVAGRTPSFYPGFVDLLRSFRAGGGLLAVVSHSDADTIRRDYATGAPGFLPDAIFGWDDDEERRKPSPYPLRTLMERYRLTPREILVVDDLKPGVVMARGVGCHVAAAAWAHRIPEIEAYMRRECVAFLETVADLAAYLLVRAAGARASGRYPSR